VDISSFLCHDVLITNVLSICLFVNFEQSYTKPLDYTGDSREIHYNNRLEARNLVVYRHDEQTTTEMMCYCY